MCAWVWRVHLPLLRAVLDTLEVAVPFWANIGILVGMTLAFRYFAYLALRRRTRVV